MKKIFPVILLLITLFSCGKKGHHVEKKYDKDGNLEMELEFLDDKPHGIGKVYYPNGKIHKLVSFNNGERHGVETIYDEEGFKHTQYTFINGKEINGASFNQKGDTISFGVSDGVRKKVIMKDKKGKIRVIDCHEIKNRENESYPTIRFDDDYEIIKYRGPLPCLTKRDTILLDRTNNKWRNLKENI